MNFAELSQLNETEARDHLERVRWGENHENRRCPHCGGSDSTKLMGKSTRPGVYKCKTKECRKQFTVTVGTVMERGHIAIRNWLLTIHLMCSSKKGMSAHQIHRQLGITYKAAWFMCHRIRHAMHKEPMAGMLMTGVVEMDEAYFGGKPRVHSHKFGPRTGPDKKAPVVVLVQRDGGAVCRAVPVVTTNMVREQLRQNVDSRSILMSDELRVYTKPGRELVAGHEVVNHGRSEYARRRDDGLVVHTNTAESFFALMKRGYIGVYHKMSKKHLHRYCDEFSFRWDRRKVCDEDRRTDAMRAIEGKRLLYKEPVNISGREAT